LMAAARKSVKKKPIKRAAKRAWCKVTVVLGPGGYALYVNDVRVSGQKPWGGGKVVEDFRPLVADVRAALKGKP
ncbi:MAG: hypothetical protein ACHREM_32280, partial [Polyangiales bacterium]